MDDSTSEMLKDYTSGTFRLAIDATGSSRFDKDIHCKLVHDTASVMQTDAPCTHKIKLAMIAEPPCGHINNDFGLVISGRVVQGEMGVSCILQYMHSLAYLETCTMSRYKQTSHTKCQQTQSEKRAEQREPP